MMTEQEAIECCCCGPPAVCAATGALAAVTARAASASVGEVTINVQCVASKCMAWRWHDYTEKGERTGYCGLAGPIED
jgi:hypothetical protein